MPNWQSPEELLKDADVFVKLIHVLSGLYAWDLILSLDFDWDFITRKKPFKWPMIFYFLDRYILLFALIGILISLNSTVRLNCQALYTFNQLAGNAAVGLASINLSLRTIAVYGNSKPLIAVLVVVILGHWSLILQGVNLTAEWSEVTNQCVITKTNNRVLAATFIYSMCFDLLVFLLNLWKLYLRRSPQGSMGTSRLGRMIFGDGLIYFFIAFLSNVLATVFMLLNLNPIMSIIFNVPAAIASTIVACAAVRRLSSFKNSPAEVYSGTSAHSLQLRGTGSRPVITPRNPNISNGVHVQMETFTREEDMIGSPSSPSQIDSYHVHYTDEAQKKDRIMGDEFDVEDKAESL